jgi:hypothetical protein
VKFSVSHVNTHHKTSITEESIQHKVEENDLTS